MIFSAGNRVERRRLDSRYEVGADGVVYSDGMPLRAVNGTWVNIHGERKLVAYLVARAFIENKESRPWVRHKNGDGKDNRVENLEWCEEKEVLRRGRGAEMRGIGKYDQDGNMVARYWSVPEAAKASGLKAADVRMALRRKGKTGGWRWLWL